MEVLIGHIPPEEHHGEVGHVDLCEAGVNLSLQEICITDTLVDPGRIL